MVKVKICGITNHRDAELASEAGADMLGVIVNVNVSTPREISVSKASSILEKVNDKVETVVVTMPENADEAEKVAEKINPDYLQIHLPLSSTALKNIKKQTGKPIIGVSKIPARLEDKKEKIIQTKELSQVSDLLLLDTQSQEGGGTGRTHN